MTRKMIVEIKIDIEKGIKMIEQKNRDKDKHGENDRDNRTKNRDDKDR